MADKVVQVEGVGNVAFPDSMSDDQISAVLRQQHPDLLKSASQAGTDQPGLVSSFVHRIGQAVKGAVSASNPLPSDMSVKGVLESPLLTAGIPLARMAEGQIQATSKAAQQAQQQFAEAKASRDAVNKPLGYARAGVTALSALNPFATQSVTNVNELEAQGQPKAAAGQGLADVALLASPYAAKPLIAASGGLRTAAADALEQSSAKNLADVLRPTTKANKFIAQNKVIPGMQEREVIAATGKGLQEKAATMREAAGQAVDDAYDAMPNQPSIPTKPVLDRLEAMKKDFTNESPQADGTFKQVVLDPDAINRIQSVQDKIAAHGDTLTPDSIRNLRQFFDKRVAKAGGFAGKTLAEGDLMDVYREAANGIRGELAKSVPGLADANAEFSFWKNLEDVMNATNQRRVGQVGGGLGRKIATGVGASVGGSIGGVKGAVIGAEAGNFLSRAFNSTAWKTVNSALKMKLANALAARDPVQVNAALHDVQEEVPALKTSAMPMQSGSAAGLPKDFSIVPDEQVNGTNLSMRDAAGKEIGSVGLKDTKIGAKSASEVGDIQVQNKGQGYGQALYQKAAEHAAANGDSFLVSSGKPSPEAVSAWQRIMKANPNDVRYINGRFMWKLDKFKVKTGTE